MNKWLKAIAQTLLATVLFLLLLEGACRLLGFPKGASRFIETAVLTQRLTSHKPKGEIRIFAYGESTMHGSHYWPYSNPAVWLDAYLQDFLPGAKIRTVNFARIGQNSSFIKDSFRDTLAYKPDLAVFYLGHNDFMPGNRYDQVYRDISPVSVFFKKLIRESSLISAVMRIGIAARVRTHKNENSDHVGVKVIETGPSDIGLENQVASSSPVYKRGIQEFKKNIGQIIRLGKKHHVPVIFFKPASNLKDFPPSCSQHGSDLTGENKKNWEGFFEEGKKAQARGDLSGALGFYENASSLDDDYAELSFRIAQIYFSQGDLEKAKALFKRAKDQDCLIVRAPREIEDYFQYLSDKGLAVVLETEKILASETPGGILGFPVVEDNVHFSPKGHSKLGRALAQEIADRDWIAPKSVWQFQKEQSFEAMELELKITPSVIFDSYLQCVSYYGSKYDNRILFAQKALEIKPDEARALRHLAWSYWLKGDRENAVKTYARLKEVHPEAWKDAVKNQPEIKDAAVGK